jgi:hypothetical protein
MAGEDQEVRVINSGSDIPTFSYSLPGKVFRITGVPILQGEELNFPQIFVDYSQEVMIYFTQRCRGTFDSFRFLVNSSASQGGRSIFYLTSNGNNAYMIFQFVFTNCFIADVLF